MSTEQLLDLLTHCLTYNPSHAITGMLLYGNGVFLQALEGDEQVITDLYRKIERDDRHVEVKLLHRRTIEARQYPEWSMGFRRLSDAEAQAVEGLRDYQKGTGGEFRAEDIAACENMMDHYATWNPLLREVDEKERHIKHLQTALKRAAGGVEMARLVLESIVDAHGTNSFGDHQQRLCTFALAQLSQI